MSMRLFISFPYSRQWKIRHLTYLVAGPISDPGHWALQAVLLICFSGQRLASVFSEPQARTHYHALHRKGKETLLVSTWSDNLQRDWEQHNPLRAKGCLLMTTLEFQGLTGLGNKVQESLLAWFWEKTCFPSSPCLVKHEPEWRVLSLPLRHYLFSCCPEDPAGLLLRRLPVSISWS